MTSRFMCVAAVVFLAGAVAQAGAATVTFRGDLQPGSEVPAVSDAGHGSAEASLDTVTHVLHYTVTFGGFTSPVTMAHFHGPAKAGVNAGVVVPLGSKPVSPVMGQVTLTAVQQQQLIDGLWYANLHTDAHPKGAARGQMLQK